MQLELLDRELGDVQDGLDFLRGRREVDRRRIAVAGHSFGGQLSLLLSERDSTLRAAVVFGAAAGSWEGSPKLRARLVAAVDRTVVPVMFVHAANDYSVAPGKVLAAEMAKPLQSRLRLLAKAGARCVRLWRNVQFLEQRACF